MLFFSAVAIRTLDASGRPHRLHGSDQPGHDGHSVLSRPSVLTARLVTDLDNLRNGRVVLGLGMAWDVATPGRGTNEFDPIGLPYSTTRERPEALADASAILRGVWGPEPFSFQGRHFTAKDARVVPPPLQGRRPIVTAGAGERTLGQVAELVDACHIDPVVSGAIDTPEQARSKREVLHRHCDALRRPYESILHWHFTIWLILAEDEESVRRKVDRYFPDGLDRIWQRCVIAGTPEQVVPYYQSYADAGMQYFVAQVLDARDKDTVRLVAQEVMT